MMLELQAVEISLLRKPARELRDISIRELAHACGKRFIASNHAAEHADVFELTRVSKKHPILRSADLISLSSFWRASMAAAPSYCKSTTGSNNARLSLK